MAAGVRLGLFRICRLELFLMRYTAHVTEEDEKQSNDCGYSEGSRQRFASCIQIIPIQLVYLITLENAAYHNTNTHVDLYVEHAGCP